MLSSAPFDGPSASVIVAIKDGKLILNPEKSDEDHDFDAEFVVSVREDRILNIEGYGDEIPEEKMGELLDFAVKHAAPLLEVQNEFQKEVGKEKIDYEKSPVSQELLDIVEKDHIKDVTEGLYNFEKRRTLTDAVVEKIQEENSEIAKKDIQEAIDYVSRSVLREGILKEDKRSHGRGLDEVRKLNIEVGVLPRVHGSALFSRGMTQCMSIVTLGSTRLAQTLESFDGEVEKRFMHHYNGPSYSYGEAGRFNYYPGRREVGHGAIGENALKKIIPSEEEFPYTVRVVGEILSQRGSSSMAATCGMTLALMDAGVRIKHPVAGISIGLITEDDDVSKYKLLVDMEDVDDFYGDMDFKVTGTKNGVTAIQLDNKLKGVPVAILKEAFTKARTARLFVLDEIAKVIAEPRKDLSKYAPRVDVIKINPERIGELIGPGGKVIKGIMAEAGEGIDIDINDDGQVNVTSVNKTQRDLVLKKIGEVVEEPEIGKIYHGKVDKITNYGAFVDVSPSISGLVHISEVAEGFVSDVSKHLKEGQEVDVKLIKIENGKQSFTMKGLDNTKPKKE